MILNNLAYNGDYEKGTAKKGAKTFDMTESLMAQYHSE